MNGGIGYRNVRGYAGEPIQQSMVTSPVDHDHRYEFRMKLGVILSVYQADSIYNKSAQENPGFRGYRHECTVQIIEDGSNNYIKLENVVIPPRVPSGMDNYEELLPRGSTLSTDPTSMFDPNLQFMDPFNLDGDFCVVGFIGGERSYPFILSWWPHPRNFVDPQTKGPSSANVNSQGFILDQSNRYFRRINGVELNVTKNGDIYLDTNYAGTQPVFGTPPQKGRLVRPPITTGGSFRGIFKPTSSFEMDWNIPQDGEGLASSPDPQLIQSNPATTPTGNTFTPTQKTSTFVKADASNLSITVPVEFKVTSKSLIEMEASSKLQLIAPVIYAGGRNTDITFDVDNSTSTVTETFLVDAKDVDVLASNNINVTAVEQVEMEGRTINIIGDQNIDVTTQDLNIEAALAAIIVAPEVILGNNSGEEKHLLNEQVGIDAVAGLASLVPPASSPSPVTNAASITSIIAYLTKLATSLNTNKTQRTTAS